MAKSDDYFSGQQEADYAAADKARLRLVKLEAALRRIADPKNWGSDGGWVGDSYPDEIAKEALQ